MKLHEAKILSTVKVIEIKAQGELRRRFFDLGIIEGTDIKASAGEILKLHAIATDPDDDYVTVSWSEYIDASTTETALTLKGAASDTISFKIPEDAKAGQKIHLIVQAQDDGEHTLTHYQQVIITIK